MGTVPVVKLKNHVEVRDLSLVGLTVQVKMNAQVNNYNVSCSYS